MLLAALQLKPEIFGDKNAISLDFNQNTAATRNFATHYSDRSVEIKDPERHLKRSSQI